MSTISTVQDETAQDRTAQDGTAQDGTAAVVDDAAVEAEMGKIVTELGAALGVLLTALGTRSGLWAALADAGPLTDREVAAKVRVHPALVREWLRAQAAGGYLEYDAAGETFTLPAPVAAAIHYGPGGALVDACATMLSSMGEGFGAFSEAFTSGRGFGWHQRTAEHWHGTDAFTQIVLPDELIGATISAMPETVEALSHGGTVVDVGCGYGFPTTAIAKLYPAAQVLGIDYHDASIAHAREQAGPDNVRFEVAAAAELPVSDYSLITFFDSLHDIGDPLGALVRARSAVAASGSVLLFEPLGADDVQDNLTPTGRMFYAVSTLACTPNAVSQESATSSEPLGGQAGEKKLRALAADAGFTRVRRLEVPAPLNLVLELRP
ncbi:class I SAM-dependent methyltransferase [Kribbella pratensis]|uniref:Methyltransferase family protein n=1 Tax=Kribbella pratensis TaxID=2512112 RepID=A0A4R8CML1_9ACTN|nr:class I SAM-dependent methyltransferase [Kribbella pratensis]TDW77285.1 methyltransferase family protein [Kribbella pratensis]